MIDQLLIGFLLAIVVASLAWKVRSLSSSGAMGAAFIGTIIFGLGGLKWAAILLTFFISSSLISRLFSKRKSGLSEKFEKGSQRDASQVLANGGIAALFAVMHYFFPNESWPWVGFVASMTAVNADTWATELGVLSPTPPRLIINGKKVEKGTSGAVSLTGTLSTIAGSCLVALISILVMPDPAPFRFFMITSTAGLFGSLFDSFLGATLQAIYYCPNCKKETERHPVHVCGTETTLSRGSKWLNNDLVNAGCSLAGSLIALVILWIVP